MISASTNPIILMDILCTCLQLKRKSDQTNINNHDLWKSRLVDMMTFQLDHFPPMLTILTHWDLRWKSSAWPSSAASPQPRRLRRSYEDSSAEETWKVEPWRLLLLAPLTWILAWNPWTESFVSVTIWLLDSIWMPEQCVLKHQEFLGTV